MKITTQMNISELPNGSTVQTGCEDNSIYINIPEDNYSIADAIELRDALTKVIEYASSGAPELVAEKREPRIFDDACCLPPDDLTKVQDKDGDVWELRKEGWAMPQWGANCDTWSWGELPFRFGSLTEVLS